MELLVTSWMQLISLVFFRLSLTEFTVILFLYSIFLTFVGIISVLLPSLQSPSLIFAYRCGLLLSLCLDFIISGLCIFILLFSISTPTFACTETTKLSCNESLSRITQTFLFLYSLFLLSHPFLYIRALKSANHLQSLLRNPIP
jgi:hypothetical protein